MQLELYFLEPVGYVGVVNAADVDGPFVRVVGVGGGFAVGGVDGFGDGAVDCGGGRGWLVAVVSREGSGREEG